MTQKASTRQINLQLGWFRVIDFQLKWTQSFVRWEMSWNRIGATLFYPVLLQVQWTGVSQRISVFTCSLISSRFSKAEKGPSAEEIGNFWSAKVERRTYPPTALERGIDKRIPQHKKLLVHLCQILWTCMCNSHTFHKYTIQWLSIVENNCHITGSLKNTASRNSAHHFQLFLDACDQKGPFQKLLPFFL